MGDAAQGVDRHPRAAAAASDELVPSADAGAAGPSPGALAQGRPPAAPRRLRRPAGAGPLVRTRVLESDAGRGGRGADDDDDALRASDAECVEASALALAGKGCTVAHLSGQASSAMGRLDLESPNRVPIQLYCDLSARGRA